MTTLASLITEGHQVRLDLPLDPVPEPLAALRARRAAGGLADLDMLRRTKGRGWDRLAGEPEDRLAAGVAWLEERLKAEGVLDVTEEQTWAAILARCADHAWAPWAGMEVWRRFPVATGLAALVSRFGERLIEPALHALRRDAPRDSGALVAWLLKAAPRQAVPDFGFDAAGRRALAYGPRAYTLALDAENGLSILDAAGQPARLPPNLAGADPGALARVREGVAGLKDFLKRFTDAFAGQLEEEMILGAGLPWPEWEALFRAHPLLQPIARRLLFEALDEQSRRAGLFFLTEDGEILGADLDPVAPAAWVRVAHPVALAAEERDAWLRIFTDSGINQPFPQLERESYGWDRATTALALPTPKVPAKAVGAALKRHGWILDPAEGYRSRVHGAGRAFGDIVARIEHTGHYENVWVLNERDQLSVQEVTFRRGKEPLTWRQLPAGVRSEVLRTLHAALPPETWAAKAAQRIPAAKADAADPAPAARAAAGAKTIRRIARS